MKPVIVVNPHDKKNKNTIETGNAHILTSILPGYITQHQITIPTEAIRKLIKHTNACFKLYIAKGCLNCLIYASPLIIQLDPKNTEDVTRSQTVIPEYTKGANCRNGDLKIMPKTTANNVVSIKGCNNVHNIPKKDLRYLTVKSALTKCNQKYLAFQILQR
jgi:hypothetical protein